MGWVYHASPEVQAASEWPTIVAVCTALSVVAVSVVCARLWIRLQNRGLAVDDYFAGASMVLAVAYAILCIVQTRYGLGLPISLRPKENLHPYTRVNFAGRPIYQIGISFFKIALLVSYLRLLQGTDRKLYRTVVWAVIGLVFVAHLGCTLALVFACDPVARSWNPDLPGKCLPVVESFTGYAIVTIVSDVVVTALPIPVLLRLNVRSQQKVGLLVVFVLGVFTTVCSIMRYTQIHEIQKTGNTTGLILWGTIEFNVGNIVSSLPFLAPVFLRKAKGYRSKQSSGYGYGNTGSHQLGKSGDRYKLSNMGHKQDAFASTGHDDERSASEENILKGFPDRSIVKSVTYTVKVDEDAVSDDAIREVSRVRH